MATPFDGVFADFAAPQRLGRTYPPENTTRRRRVSGAQRELRCKPETHSRQYTTPP